MKALLILTALTAIAWLAFSPSGKTAAPSDIEGLKAEVDRLKGIVPDQSHAMKDVAYHYSNLWFAGEAENWPLAEFYFNESRSHLRWAVRIIPVRKTPDGQELRLEDLLTGFENGALKELGDAVKSQDLEKFRTGYQQMLGSCYACHVAAGKPYLRLKIPDRPEVPIIDFSPQL